MSLETFISDLVSGNQALPATAFAVNEAERDGNVDDLLFRIDQPSIGIAGGTTITSLSPYTAVADLGQGKLSLAALIWLGVALFGGWILFRKR